MHRMKVCGLALAVVALAGCLEETPVRPIQPVELRLHGGHYHDGMNHVVPEWKYFTQVYLEEGGVFEQRTYSQGATSAYTNTVNPREQLQGLWRLRNGRLEIKRVRKRDFMAAQVFTDRGRMSDWIELGEDFGRGDSLVVSDENRFHVLRCEWDGTKESNCVFRHYVANEDRTDFRNPKGCTVNCDSAFAEP
jgi:hypothetical protein